MGIKGKGGIKKGEMFYVICLYGVAGKKKRSNRIFRFLLISVIFCFFTFFFNFALFTSKCTTVLAN